MTTGGSTQDILDKQFISLPERLTKKKVKIIYLKNNPCILFQPMYII